MGRGRRHGPDPARISRWAAQQALRMCGSLHLNAARRGRPRRLAGPALIMHAEVIVLLATQDTGVTLATSGD
jgi:hypothetical protein